MRPSRSIELLRAAEEDTHDPTDAEELQIKLVAGDALDALTTSEKDLILTTPRGGDQDTGGNAAQHPPQQAALISALSEIRHAAQSHQPPAQQARLTLAAEILRKVATE